MALTEFSLRSLRSPSCHGTRCSTQYATFCFQRLAELRADVNAVSGAGVNAAYLVRTPAQVQAERGGKGRKGAGRGGKGRFRGFHVTELPGS